MRIDQWHEQKLASDPDYAAAAKLTQLVEDVADTVLRARLKAGISQAALAKRAGTTQAVISRLESGDGNPSAELIGRVALAIIGLHAPMELEEKADAREDAAPSDHWKPFAVSTGATWTRVTTGRAMPSLAVAA